MKSECIDLCTLVVLNLSCVSTFSFVNKNPDFHPLICTNQQIRRDLSSQPRLSHSCTMRNTRFCLQPCSFINIEQLFLLLICSLCWIREDIILLSSKSYRSFRPIIMLLYVSRIIKKCH